MACAVGGEVGAMRVGQAAERGRASARVYVAQPIAIGPSSGE